jgi:hypothetical protein
LALKVKQVLLALLVLLALKDHRGRKVILG